MEKINYHGWEAIRLANKAIEIVALTGAGPRIIRLGFLGGENLFGEAKETVGKIGPKDVWTIYGGHRLWHGPEMLPRTHAPDNRPVNASWEGDTLTLAAPGPDQAGIDIEMQVALAAADTPVVNVVHRLTNRNMWTVELACWAVSVVAPGGRVMLPLTPGPLRRPDGNFPPDRHIALWPYTDMSDLRFRWGKNAVQLLADSAMPSSQKVGVYCREGWGAYEQGNNGDLLVVYSQPDEHGASVYPDGGSNYEAYVAGDLHELETMGPLTPLAPNQVLSRTEHWVLFKNACLPETDEELGECLPELIDRGRAMVQSSFVAKVKFETAPAHSGKSVRLPNLPEE